MDAQWVTNLTENQNVLFTLLILSLTDVHLSEGRGQNNQQPTPNDNKSKWWSSSVVLVYDLHRGMC